MVRPAGQDGTATEQEYSPQFLRRGAVIRATQEPRLAQEAEGQETRSQEASWWLHRKEHGGRSEAEQG